MTPTPNPCEPSGEQVSRPTCGVLYEQSVNQFAKTEAERAAFAAGHVSGQAEKVYLGACQAAMFRPQPECFDALLEVVRCIANRYDLLVNVFPYEGPDSRRREIWISRHDVGAWIGCKVDSPTWHKLRGEACGVPEDEIDPFFHQRRGYNEPCDGTASLHSRPAPQAKRSRCDPTNTISDPLADLLFVGTGLSQDRAVELCVKIRERFMVPPADQPATGVDLPSDLAKMLEEIGNVDFFGFDENGEVTQFKVCQAAIAFTEIHRIVRGHWLKGTYMPDSSQQER